MENNEFENKIIKKVRNKIVVSNLEMEENMKLNKRKEIISVCAVSLVLLFGGFFTVNAATDGKLVDEIKDVITITFDENKYNATLKDVTKDENGEDIVTYEVNSKDNDEHFEMQFNKSILEDENLKMETKIIQDEEENSVEMQIEGTVTDYEYNK